MQAGGVAPRSDLQAALDGLGIPADAVVVPTPWRVGSVAAYLFYGEPVTLVDCGLPTPQSVAAIEDALRRRGLRAEDVSRIIVTHGHGDHVGGAATLQGRSGCEVVLGAADAELMRHPPSRACLERVLRAFGFEEETVGFLAGARSPSFEVRVTVASPSYECGGRLVDVEVRPGHTPGHLWVTDRTSGAVFVGDYLLAGHPSNPGLVVGEDECLPLLRLYEEGLRELGARPAPVLLPGHGPPLFDHATLAARRLARSERRTLRVRAALALLGPSTLAELGSRLWRDRLRQSWEAIADLAGRLDALVGRGQATARLGEDGVWYFQAVP